MTKCLKNVTRQVCCSKESSQRPFMYKMPRIICDIKVAFLITWELID